MNNPSPLVSVIITTYRRPVFLKRAIESVLDQSYENIELIIVDDNNEDSKERKQTEKIIQTYSEKKYIIYLKHTQNSNGSVARNTGLKKAKGEFVTYLDDDDTYRKDKIKNQVNFLIANIEYDSVYCGWNRNCIDEVPSLTGDLSYEILSGDIVIRTNTIMMNKKVALKIGGWNEEYKRNQEAVYLLRYFMNGYKIGVVKKVLVDYDISDRRNIANHKENEANFKFFLEDHKELIEKINNENPGAKKNILVKRRRGVLLSYLKSNDILNSFRVYLGTVLKYPIKTNTDLISYFFNYLIK